MSAQPARGMKQVGWCEVCGDAAYSTRHTSMLVIERDGRIYNKAVSHHMCPRHKAHYFAHMEEERKKLEEKQKHGSTKTQVSH